MTETDTKTKANAKPKGTPRPEMVARLRDGVEALLEDSTYAEIKVDDLVRESGLAKSTFYAYFDDKTALLSLLAERVISDLANFEGALWTLPPGATKAETRAALEGMFEAYRPHALLINAVAEAAIYDPSMKAQFADLMSGIVGATAEHLRQGQAAGIVPSELDAQHTAFSLIWMLERGFSLLLLASDPPSLERRLDAVTEIVSSASHGSER